MTSAGPPRCQRIIPRLDIKGPNLVKGIHLEGLRVLGRPESFARYYYEHGADELVYVDVVASLYGRNSILDFVERTGSAIFVPLTVGGGVRTLDDIQAILRVGGDKVAINTEAIRRPSFVSEAARRYGSSTIVVSIEAIRQPDGRYEAYTDCGRERTGVDVFEWAVRAEELGAGELMVTSIDREGTGKGYDLELTRRVADSVSIPVIACGGAGRIEHVREVLMEGHADAVGLASMLHYSSMDICTENLSAVADEGNVEFMKRGKRFSKMQRAQLEDVKRDLVACGLECRQESYKTSDV